MRSIRRHLVIAFGFAIFSALTLGTDFARAADRENGDLFVGSASFVDGYGSTAGGIWRVRGHTATLFCASPVSSFDPGFWNVPNTIVVDSQGRIVFLAAIAGQNIGLLRCDQLGAPAEQLAAFQVRGSIVPGWPVPFPDLQFGVRIGSLHILKQRVITEDFTGQPQVHNGDIYEFVAQQQSQSGDPTIPGPSELFRYNTDALAPSQQWMHGNDLPDVPNLTGNLTNVVAHGDSLYMLNGGVLRRTSLPFELGLAGQIGGTDFSLHLGLFGGTHELASAIVDDTTVPNVSSGCNTDPPGLHDDVTDAMPLVNGGFVPFSANSLAYDEHGTLGLVGLSTYGPNPGPYLTQLTSELLNDDPLDDDQGYFHQPYDNCRHVPWIHFAPILPFTPAAGPAFANVADVIATAPGGMVGTQFWGDRVFRLTPGDHVTDIVTLYHPGGIAAYPAVIPSLGTVVYVTIHSPVDVLVTDATGRRIGTDPVTHAAVNDFAQNGYDTGAGEPRVLVIKNPLPGAYTVDAVGTGSGPFTIDISAADLTTGASDRIQTSGLASLGSRSEPDFTLLADSSLSFASSPVIDSIPPTITASATKGDGTPYAAGTWTNQSVLVHFSCSDNPGGSGVVSCSADQLISAEGTSNVSGTATDNAGLSANTSFGPIKIDKTPPTTTCSATPSVLWPPNHKLVPVTATVGVTDARSGTAGFSLVSVTSSEPDSNTGGGDMPNDIQGWMPGATGAAGLLRAERSGAGVGRIYTLTVQGRDAAGNVARCNTTVRVPHDQGK